MASSRPGSPLFDVPEFPALRRVKPLPKRRRTSAEAPLPAPPPPPADGDTTFFMPITDDGDGSASEGDYPDPHAGNTKKRKVPAHALGGPDTRAASPGAADDPPGGGGQPNSTNGTATATGGYATDDTDGSLTARGMNRLHTATRVGLARKEMLRARRRQLGTVLGTPAHGDTLALDQALAMRYPLLARVNGQKPDDAPHGKLRRRLIAPPESKILKITNGEENEDPDNGITAPAGDFTFECHSATGDRLAETLAEVAVLHERIEAELARQVARAEEAARIAAEHAAAARLAAKARPQTTITPSHAPARKEPAALPPSTPAPPATTNKKGKKKKRSALANASNPHHLRNYVPSRLPNQPATNKENAAAQNLLSPLPVRFLAAGTGGGKDTVDPQDEWICPTCEYRLFYGGDAEYRLAIRNRKKILKRRKRARERAAAAASGKRSTAAAPAPAPAPAPSGIEEEFDDEDYEDGPEDVGGDYNNVPRYADGVGTGPKGRIKDGGQ